MHEPVPFSTTNAILAFALENAGVPRFRTPTNSFTEESLRRLYAGKGFTLIEGLRDAWKKKIRGEVRYWFEKTPELPFLLKAYEDQEAIINAPGDQDGGELVREIIARATGRDPKTSEPIPQMDEREALVRLTCVFLKGRVIFMDLWKTLPPRLTIPRSGEVEHLGNNTTRHPGFDEIGADASDERLQKMGLL